MRLCLACGSTFSSTTWVCPECTWNPVEGEFPMFAPELAQSSEHYPREAIAQLAALEQGYFWAPARNELIRWMIAAYFPQARELLEVGCGTGFVLSHLRRAFPALSLSGGDLLPEALAFAQDRIPDARFIQVDIRRLPYTEEFDVVCALDVLEHIDEDRLALNEIARALRPGGGIVVAVPQHPWLWSAWDEFNRHRRRYSKRSFLAMLDNAGFDVLRATSSVSLLLPLVLISVMRNRHSSEGYDPYQELKLPRVVNRAFAAIMRAERSLIRQGISLPIGSSLTAVARKR